MRTSSLFAIPGFALVLAACSAADRPSEIQGSAEHVAKASSAVINGELDTTHQAVVAIVLQSGSQGGLCSGTIVKTDPVAHIGWVVAAAHCVALPPVYVLQGDDFSVASSVLRYDVIDYQADTRYTGQPGSPYDFAVLRIAGVDATTPTLPLATANDGIGVGTNVVSVGYGRTTLIASGTPTTENTARRHVAKQLNQVGQMIAFDMASSGICQGDSGGPVLVGSPGSEKVVGVHSYVEGDCNGTGVSSRVSFDLSFLSGELAKALPTDSCELCGKVASSGNGTCAAATRSCLADAQCSGYYECLSSGGAKPACLVKFPKAEGPFNAAANCQCTQACTTECKGTYECVSTPKCGYKLPAGACSTCTESACCAEALACAADGTCYVCLKTNDAAAECATNAARKVMANCVASKCNAECAGTALGAGADPNAADAGPDPALVSAADAPATTTTTTSGCAMSGAPSRPAAPSLAALVALLVLVLRRAGGGGGSRNEPPSRRRGG